MDIPTEDQIIKAVDSECCNRDVSCDYDCAAVLRGHKDILVRALHLSQARVLELEARLPHYHNEKQCGIIKERIEELELIIKQFKA